MAWCLMAQGIAGTNADLLSIETLGRNFMELHGNFNENRIIFIQQNAFENVCKIAVILVRPELVKSYHILTISTELLNFDPKTGQYVSWKYNCKKKNGSLWKKLDRKWDKNNCYRCLGTKHDVNNARMAETYLATTKYLWPAAVDTLTLVKT